MKELSGILLEILFAPGFEPDALEELRRTKKKCRVFELPVRPGRYPARLAELRSVLGGLLVQDADLADLDPAQLKVVSRRAPTDAELARCASPGAWPSTPSPTPSCSRPPTRWSGWAPAR